MDENKHHIKNWASDEQPRERLMHKGANALSDAELLTILIGTGIKGMSAMDLARKLLQLAEHSWVNLGAMQPREIMAAVKGIGPAKAISICAALEIGRRREIDKAPPKKRFLTAAPLAEILKQKIGHLSTESFYVFYMNRATQILAEEELFVGTMTATLVDVRVILKRAIECKAVSIICGHNHPSGICKPSDADIKLTAKLRQACRLLDIELLDHIIIAGDEFYSFRNEGILDG